MSKRKLLLADDSITIQKVVNLTFAEEGIEVIAFGDGDSAVESMDEVQPDIVLADVNMPGMNGYQICELMRANEGTKHVPVILLVGSFEPFDMDEANRVGADRYLTKPFSSIAELVTTVNELLDAAARTEDAAAFDEAISEPSSELPDTNDIDSLYRQSFIETVEFSHTDDLDIEFSDDEIDDEMIQTSYAESDIDSLANASFFADDEADDFIGVPETEPFGAVEDKVESDALDKVAFEPMETEQEKQPVVDEPAREQPVQNFDEADTLSLDDEDVSAPNDSFAEPETPHFETGVSSEPVQNFEEAETFNFETDKVELPSSMSRLNDFDILEIPDVPSGKSYEFTTPEQAADKGSKTQVVSLSPELMEILVQKVVEKLAEKY
ncbi:MAG: response regulator [Pyrinomonadaceae bacterium]